MSKTVSYRVLIKLGEKHYKLGTIIIKRYEGDVIYAPSQLGVRDSNTNLIGKIINHISWHKSGRVHVKTKDNHYGIFEEGSGVLNPVLGIKQNRQEIKDIGFQEIVRDTVIDITSLKEHTKKVDKLDIVFNIGNYKGPVQFHFSIVSGTHIVAIAEGKDTPVKVSKKSIKLRLDGQKRALGYESGNADKLLQYGLYKYVGNELKSGRRVFAATDSGISKIKPEDDTAV